MNRSASLYAASLGLALLTFGTASQAGAVSTVEPSTIARTSLSETVSALGGRVLDASLQSGLAGSAVTDATVTPPSAVPEPGTMALLGFGLAAMVVGRRRKGRSPR